MPFRNGAELDPFFRGRFRPFFRPGEMHFVRAKSDSNPMSIAPDQSLNLVVILLPGEMHE
jgi:hypothetical protein